MRKAGKPHQWKLLRSWSFSPGSKADQWLVGAGSPQLGPDGGTKAMSGWEGSSSLIPREVTRLQLLQIQGMQCDVGQEESCTSHLHVRPEPTLRAGPCPGASRACGQCRLWLRSLLIKVTPVVFQLCRCSSLTPVLLRSPMTS